MQTRLNDALEMTAANLQFLAGEAMAALNGGYGAPGVPGDWSPNGVTAGLASFDDPTGGLHGSTSLSTQLAYGVPGARITDPFYRSRAEKQSRTGRTGGRQRHLGIDVSTSNARGGGANDPRRGLPVYASIRGTIPVADLNRAWATDSRKSPTTLNIPGRGNATLHEAVVLTQPWSSQSSGAYGGVLGLACRYNYTKNDGSAGRFTLYVEFLHLITPTFLPKDGSGNVLSAATWQATGKGIGFGPRMTNRATLSAADLTGAQPLLVGYLGATQFPHVHIQVAYRDGTHRYLRHPRVDPAVVMIASQTVTGTPSTGTPAPATPLNLIPSEVVYNVQPGQEYGPHWRNRRPPGLPASARLTSRRGEARPFIEQLARQEGISQVFVTTVAHLAETESGAMFARPADRFDARPPSSRPANRPLITAWGAFQFNRDAWRALPGVAANAFPWEANRYDEIALPVRRYADLFRSITTAGGGDTDAARGIRLWHRTPAGFNTYLRNGRRNGFAAAWEQVAERHRNVVDRHLRAAGVAQELGESIAQQASPPPRQRFNWAQLLNHLATFVRTHNNTADPQAVRNALSHLNSFGVSLNQILFTRLTDVSWVHSGLYKRAFSRSTRSGRPEISVNDDMLREIHRYRANRTNNIADGFKILRTIAHELRHLQRDRQRRRRARTATVLERKFEAELTRRAARTPARLTPQQFLELPSGQQLYANTAYTVEEILAKLAEVAIAKFEWDHLRAGGVTQDERDHMEQILQEIGFRCYYQINILRGSAQRGTAGLTMADFTASINGITAELGRRHGRQSPELRLWEMARNGVTSTSYHHNVIAVPRVFP